MRRWFTVGVILLIIGFLGGFIPQYLKTRDLNQQLAADKKQLASCQLNQQLSDIRDDAAMVYVQATQKNYGIAANYAKQLFDQAQQTVGQTDDPNVRKLLNDVLAVREPITADLANGDAAVVSKLQPLLANLEQNRQH